MLNKQSIIDFKQNYIDIIIIAQYHISNSIFSQLKAKVQEFVSMYEKLFPVECAKIVQAWQLFGTKASLKQFIILLNDIVIEMANKFDDVYKPPKLFISHSEKDKAFVEKFVTMLEQIGVKQEHLFCSSIVGYCIPQGSGNIYDYIRNEMNRDNLFVIMMLSDNYYSSPVCLNEMGAAWVNRAKYQTILLPGFDFNEIEGAIDPRDISFKIDDKTNRNHALNELKDNIIQHLELNSIDHSLWERFRDKLTGEIDLII